MLDWITIFSKYISLKQVDFLKSKFEFGGFFSLKTGEEIPMPVRNDIKNYDKTLWSRAILKSEIIIMIGVKHNTVTHKDDYFLKVAGSLHRYAKGNNDGYFTSYEAVKALNEICDELKIDKGKATINRLEIGINFPLANAFSFLKLNVIKRYKDNPFKENSDRSYNGYHVYLTHYYVKLYAKDKNILRFEIHWDNLQELRKRYKIKVVSDITPELINRIALETLTERATNIICLNGVDIITKVTRRNDGMKKDELLLLTQFSNSIYLDKLKERLKECPKGKRNAIYQADRRARIKFENTLKKYQKMDFVKYLRDQIVRQVGKEKCQLFIFGELQQEASKTGYFECQTFNTGIKLKKLTHDVEESTLINKLNSNDRICKIRKAMEDKGELINKIKIGNRHLAPC